MKKARYKVFDNDICKIIDNILRIIIVLIIIIKLFISQYDGIGMLLLTFLLTFYDLILTKVFKIKLNKSSKIMLSIFIFLAQLLGTCLNFYDKFVWWDIMLHFLSGIMLYFVGINVVLNIFKKYKLDNVNKMLIYIFSVFFALAIGNLWEIYEFLADTILKLNTQRAKNLIGRLALKDTMTDLISSTIGTTFAFIITCFLNKKEEAC